MKRTHYTRTALTTTTVIIAGVMTLSGCAAGFDASPTNSEQHAEDAHLTRAQLYSDVDALTADSAAIVVGTVTEQRVAADIDDATDFTISSFEITKTLKSDGMTRPGAVVDVRQVGSEEQAPPTDLLTPGATYLLYLTASGLDGDLASHYYVTGANAGIYKALDDKQRSTSFEQGDLRFVQVEGTEGEPLPTELYLDELG